MADKRVKARIAIATAVAALAGVLVASVAGAGAQGIGDYTTSTTSTATTTTPTTTTQTTTTQPQRSRRIHYSLRFRYLGKHRRGVVVARVYCHSPGCILSAKGTLRIKPYNTNKRGRVALKKVRAQKFNLGSASGTFPRRKGRTVAGRMRFRVPARGTRAVRKAIRAKARGKIRATIAVDGSNTLAPDRTQRKRQRNIKLFCGAGRKPKGGRCTPKNGS